MASFVYNDITYDVIYVDTTGGAGDGTTLATSRNTFPTFSSIAANTCVVIRRVGSPISLSAAITNANNNVMIVGSPKIGDLLYSLIPDVSSWESDINENVSITFPDGTSGMTFSGSGIYLERLSIIQNAVGTSHSTNFGIINTTSTAGGCSIKSCTISISGATNYTNGNTVTPIRRGVAMTGPDNTIDGCNIETPDQAVFLIGPTGPVINATLSNSTFKTWDGSSTVEISTGLTDGSSVKLFKCDIYNKVSSGSGICLNFSSSFSFDTVMNYCNLYKDTCAGTPTAANIGSTTSNVNISFTNFYWNLNMVGTGSAAYMTYIQGYVTFRNCTFSTTSDTHGANTAGLYLITNTTTAANYFNCTFDAKGIIGAITNNDSKNNIFSNCTFTKGTVSTHQPLYIPNMVPALGAAHAVSLGNGVAYIGNLDLTGISQANTRFILTNNAKIFIDTTNGTLPVTSAYTSNVNFNSSETAAIYIRNEGAAGNWTARSLNTMILTSNSYRIGSSKTYSLKAQTHTAAGRRRYLWVAPQPFEGIPVNFGTTGKKKITLYYAHKLYSNAVLPSDLVLEVEIPSAVSGADRSVVTSVFNGYMSSDNSSWSGDTGLTIRKLEVFFDMLQVGNAYCRIGFYKYHVDGYTLIDTGLVGSSI